MTVGEFIFSLSRASRKIDDEAVFFLEHVEPPMSPHHRVVQLCCPFLPIAEIYEGDYQISGDGKPYGDPIPLGKCVLLSTWEMTWLDFDDDEEEKPFTTVADIMMVLSGFDPDLPLVLHSEYNGMNYEVDVINQTVFVIGSHYSGMTRNMEVGSTVNQALITLSDLQSNSSKWREMADEEKRGQERRREEMICIICRG